MGKKLVRRTKTYVKESGVGGVLLVGWFGAVFDGKGTSRNLSPPTLPPGPSPPPKIAGCLQGTLD